MFNWNDFKEALKRQRDFSDLFFNAESMSPLQKREMLKTFVISLHTETTGICEAMNYKEHRLSSKQIDVQKILYKSVDAYRYILAILNLFNVSHEDFINALAQKDEFLHYRNQLSKKKWSGQPVAIFDMDDVLANFRKSFCAWATNECGHFIDPESDEYYNVREFKRLNINGEQYFKKFMDTHGFLTLERDDNYFGLLQHLKERGWWIQILTARPSSNLPCFYDTYSWLSRNGIDADGIAFSPEKLTWVCDQEFYTTGKYFAIDDSGKHSAEYAKHSVPVLVPEKPYNQEVRGTQNVTYVPRGANPIDFIPVI
jgi:hypothetical protein